VPDKRQPRGLVQRVGTILESFLIASTFSSRLDGMSGKDVLLAKSSFF